MASLGRLTIDMVANLAGFEKDMGRAQRVTAKSMQSVRRDLRRAERDADKARASLKRLGMQMGALAAVGVGVVAREFDRINRSANNLDKVSKVVAINVEELQKLRFAAQQAAGVASTTLDMAMQRFSRRVGEAANGTGELMGIVEELGISLRDSSGNIRSQTDLLAEFADRITATTSAQEQLRIAFKLFDSEGARLLPLLNQGSQAFRDLMQQAEDTGGVISQTAVRDFVRFNDELEVLRMRASSLSITIAEDLIGGLADFVEFLNTEEGTRRLKETLEDIAATVEVVGTMIGIRMVAQLGAYSLQLGIATAATIKHQIALAGMSKTAATTMATMRGLGIAIRGLFGPLGIAAAALGVFAVSARDSTGVLAGFNEELRDMRFETRQFANEQQLAQDIQSFRDEAKEAGEQIEQLKSGLSNLASDRQPGERLRDYEMRMGAVAEKTKLANAEIERLEQVQADATAKANELGKEYDKLETATRETTDATEGLNDAMADDRRQQFLRDMQDLSDELEGPAAQAARTFAREIERLQGLLNEGIISPEEYANFARGLAQIASQGIEDDEVQKSFADVAAEGIGRGIERAFGSMTAGDIATMSFSQVGGVIGKSIFGELGRGFGEMFEGAFSDFGESIGESIGNIAGESMGEAMGKTFGKVFGEIAGPIGEALGRFIFDKIFPQKDPKFQVGGATGFGATGAGRISMDLSSATPFGNLFIRFRKITAEAQDQLRDALITFDQTIASIVSDEGQMKRISDALAQWGFDTQDEGLTLERVLRSRFDAIVNTFDQFGQDMIRSGSTLDEQITNMMDLINIRARMAIGDSFGPGISDNTQVFLAMDLARANETMAQSFQRLLTITDLLNKAMALTGNEISGGTAAVVRFGDALQRAFGDDLDRLNTSLNIIFDTFFDADEILEQSATATKRKASQLFADLGIEVTDALFTKGGFRELFDSLSGVLSPEDLAILIEAGVLVSQYIGYEEELTQVRSDGIGVLTSLTAEGEAFAQAMIATEEAIAVTPLNSFQREMLGINRQLFRTINAINAAAGSAITQEAAERALARAHEAAAIQAAAAIARLESNTLRLVQQVFGEPMDEVNNQMASLSNNSMNLASSLGSAADAMQSLIAFADSLLIGNLSPLPSRQRLGIGLEELRAASEAGDVSAVQSLAQQVLQIGRERFASGPEFAALFEEVQDIIRSTVPAQDIQDVSVVDSPALQTLFEQRDSANAEIAAADRKANATDIAQSIADISSVTGESFEEVADRLGVPLDGLAEILGLDYEELDAFLSSLQTDTMTLAQTLEQYATDIRAAILDMTNAIIEALGDQSEGPLVGPPAPSDRPPNTVDTPPNDGSGFGPFLPQDPPEQPPQDPPERPPEEPPVGPPAPPGDGPGIGAPPPPVYKPPGDHWLDPNQVKMPISDGGAYNEDVAFNTAQTVEQIRRLVDAFERSNTRSNRTALA